MLQSVFEQFETENGVDTIFQEEDIFTISEKWHASYTYIID